MSPKTGIGHSETVRNGQAKAEVEDDELMLLFVLGVRTDKHVSRVGVAVDEPSYEYLFRKGSDEVVHDLLLVEVVPPHLLDVSDLEALDPL